MGRWLAAVLGVLVGCGGGDPSATCTSTLGAGFPNFAYMGSGTWSNDGLDDSCQHQNYSEADAITLSGSQITVTRTGGMFAAPCMLAGTVMASGPTGYRITFGAGTIAPHCMMTRTVGQATFMSDATLQSATVADVGYSACGTDAQPPTLELSLVWTLATTDGWCSPTLREQMRAVHPWSSP